MPDPAQHEHTEHGHQHGHDQHGHDQHGHDHPHPVAPGGHDHASWEERYTASEAVWSGRANPPLVAEATDLAPGRALDVGSGEGGDALWLAARGWQVTAVDWSQTALDRAARIAADAGLADRVEWVRGDLADWVPPTAAFDLVTAHFLHPEAAVRHRLVPRLAAAVAPGRTLLWVGHGFSAERAEMWGADRFASAVEVAADLDPAEWDIAAGARPRPPGDPHQHEADEVVRARRR